MTCTITQKNGLDTMPLHFYRYLRRKGYTHRHAVTSVLMYYSPSKEDLYRRVVRRQHYIEAVGVKWL